MPQWQCVMWRSFPSISYRTAPRRHPPVNVGCMSRCSFVRVLHASPRPAPEGSLRTALATARGVRAIRDYHYVALGGSAAPGGAPELKERHSEARARSGSERRGILGGVQVSGVKTDGRGTGAVGGG